jgi:hypothetical protein
LHAPDGDQLGFRENKLMIVIPPHNRQK